MGMPKDLVLVRHGQSEGNEANRLSRKGDDRHFTPGFLNRHSSTWRLTSKGVEQAKAAGDWLRANNLFTFHRAYASQYLRAQETAAHLGLDVNWYLEFYLRERDFGELDVLPDGERKQRFARELARRQLDGHFWIPPNGESMATVCLRVDRIFDTLHRECDGKRVIMVDHGETILAKRMRLERLTQEQLKRLEESDDDKDRIHNGQILHYTRRNPETGEILPYLGWMRSVCPWDETKSRNTWEPIVRKKFTNAELLATVEATPRMVDNE